MRDVARVQRRLRRVEGDAEDEPAGGGDLLGGPAVRVDAEQLAGLAAAPDAAVRVHRDALRVVQPGRREETVVEDAHSVLRERGGVAGEQAAVDLVLGPGDERRARTGQEGDDLGDLLGPRDPAERMRPAPLGDLLVLAEFAAEPGPPPSAASACPPSPGRRRDADPVRLRGRAPWPGSAR